jgi:hypothetical protein
MTLDAITDCKIKRFLRTFAGFLIFGALFLSIFASAQTTSAPAADSKADPKSVPVVDGGIGPCTADFTITDSAGAPVYAATVKVHIAFGFMGARKLDLEVGTNAAGQARMTGLPQNVKHGFFFEASQGDRTGTAFADPAVNCKSHFTIALQKKQ